MALGDPYITAAELKTYAKVTDADDDTLIGEVVNAISRTIERYTGRQFNDAGSTSARVYQPAACDVVRVDDFSTVTGLVVESDTAGDGTYAATLSAANYSAAPHNGIVDGQSGHPFREIILYQGQTFVSNARPSVQVTARWGWAAVPADVKQAAYIQGARIFKRRESVDGVQGFGDFVVRVSTRLDPDVEDMLKHYRVHALVA